MYLFGVTRWDHINKTCPYILVWGHSLAWIFLSGSPHEIQSSNMQEHSARASYIVLAPTLPRVRSAPLLQYRLSNQGETPFEIDINAHTYVWICKYIYRERERERDTVCGQPRHGWSRPTPVKNLWHDTDSCFPPRTLPTNTAKHTCSESSFILRPNEASEHYKAEANESLNTPFLAWVLLALHSSIREPRIQQLRQLNLQRGSLRANEGNKNINREQEYKYRVHA